MPCTTIPDYRRLVTFAEEKAAKIELASSERSRVTLWCLGPGQHIHPHTHAGDHIWMVLEGRGRLLGDDEQPVSAGSVLFLPQGEPHGMENDGEEGLVFMSVSAG